jgi:phenylpropionate dioxygenase-like ring-hydroxylating dioxygenase large terminal subunit
MQTENGADGYHVTTVHWNYAATTERRKQAAQPDNVRAMSASGVGKHGGGFHSFENGHLLLWTNWANPEDRPNWDRREELAARFGRTRAVDYAQASQQSRSLALEKTMETGSIKAPSPLAGRRSLPSQSEAPGRTPASDVDPFSSSSNIPFLYMSACVKQDRWYG